MAPEREEYTLGEIGRWLQRLTDSVDGLSGRFESLAATFVLQAVYMSEKQAQVEKETEQDRRIAELEESNRWLSRTVLGTVIMMILTGSLAAYFAFAGG